MRREEQVMIARADFLRILGDFQGVQSNAGRYFDAIIHDEQYEFMDRNEAETDFRFKQIIPWVVMVHGGEVFCHERGRASGEGRLHGVMTMGIGGHVRRIFGQEVESYHNGMAREVLEEVGMTVPNGNAPVAVVNDDSDDVGRVHFGFVHILRVDSQDIKVREHGLCNPCFMTFEELVERRSRLDNWSRHILARSDCLGI